MKNVTNIPKGFDGLVNDVIGFYKRRNYPLMRLRERAVLAYEDSLAASSWSDEELATCLEKLKAEVRRSHDDATLLQGLACICETAFRTLRVRPYVEQIMGALALHDHYAIQMHTGEGKTLTATLAAVLSGWQGRFCHVVTSNDYLARRDAEQMGPLYERCGLRVGFVISSMEPLERKEAYLRDVLYSTSKELLADFLRDKLKRGGDVSKSVDLIHRIAGGDADNQRIMRGLDFAIIDEADSVLADEATVPLIISVSGKNRLLKEAVQMALQISQSLYEDEDYRLLSNQFDVEMSSQGKKKSKMPYSPYHRYGVPTKDRSTLSARH